MKRGLKVLIIVLVILVVLAVAILLVKHFTTNEVNNELTGNSISYDNADAIATMDVVIVRVDDTYLEVINKDDPNDVMRANIPDDAIPEKALKLFYSSRNNVSVSNINVTQTGISFEIKDTNEYKYEYTNTYTLFKKNPEAEQVKAPSMPIVTGNTTSSYEGSGIPLWEEASKVSDVNSEDTVTSENIAEDTVRKICDWTNIYGKLESGEYDFSLTVEGFYIRIKFTVNENGEISNVTSDFM